MTDPEIVLGALLIAMGSYTFGGRVTARRISRSMRGRPSGLFSRLEMREMRREHEEHEGIGGQLETSELKDVLARLKEREGAAPSAKPGPYL